MAATTPANILASAPPVSATNDILPIKPPVEIPSGWEWLWWTLGALALIVGGILLWQRLRRKAILPSAPPIPPHVRARQRLAEALRLIIDPRAFCIEVSDALRIYLEERFSFHAPERTTDEFLVELQGTKLLTPDQKQSLGEFLQSCDLVKFARFEPTETALRELHESALRLIDETQFDAIVPAPPAPVMTPPPASPRDPNPPSAIINSP